MIGPGDAFVPNTFPVGGVHSFVRCLNSASLCDTYHPAASSSTLVRYSAGGALRPLHSYRGGFGLRKLLGYFGRGAKGRFALVSGVLRACSTRGERISIQGLHEGIPLVEKCMLVCRGSQERSIA